MRYALAALGTAALIMFTVPAVHASPVAAQWLTDGQVAYAKKGGWHGSGKGWKHGWWAWMGSPPGMAARSAAVGTSLGLAPQTRLVERHRLERAESRYKSGRCLSWGEGEEPGLHIATASFDHLVREQEHGGWDGHAERFSGL
jgi:hypothetical protein